MSILFCFRGWGWRWLWDWRGKMFLLWSLPACLAASQVQRPQWPTDCVIPASVSRCRKADYRVFGVHHSATKQSSHARSDRCTQRTERRASSSESGLHKDGWRFAEFRLHGIAMFCTAIAATKSPWETAYSQRRTANAAPNSQQRTPY